jgi:hypothetical protein
MLFFLRRQGDGAVRSCYQATSLRCSQGTYAAFNSRVPGSVGSVSHLRIQEKCQLGFSIGEVVAVKR